MSFEQSPLWLATLASRENDPDQVPRERLRVAYLQMRDQVRPIANDAALSVPNYTDHGLNHCDSLWESASLLIVDPYAVTPAEAFVLGCAFLVHDLGMGVSAYPGGIQGILDSIEWIDLLGSYFPKDHAEIQANAKSDASLDPTWNGLTDARAKVALTAFLRNNHASRAEELLADTWKLTSGDEYHLLSDTALRHWYGPLIGRIAKSHWTDVAILPDSLADLLGSIPDFPPAWTVRPVWIACALRLADATQVDARRADPLHTPHRMPQGDSLPHWEFQERFLLPVVNDGRLEYTSAVAFGPELIDAWWLAYDTVRAIDSELRRVDNLCGDLGLPRYAASACAGAESPNRFAAFVAVDSWQPIDARPYIGDQNLVMERLGGRELYGSTPGDNPVPLRELLANAMDATRAIRLAFAGHDPKPIRVEISAEEESDVLIVRDYGIGMTSDEMVTRLCNFGASGWRDSSMRAAFPGMLSGGFNPTGRFGLGFFSVFMCADDVKVVSRRVDVSMAETSVLEFTGGIRSRPVLRTAAIDERLIDPGTVVTLKLREPLVGRDGLFPFQDDDILFSSEEFAGLIRRIALMSDEAIEAKASGDTAVVAVVGDAWKTCDAGSLFDMLNPESVRNSPSYAANRLRFSRQATPMFDSQGSQIGRLGLDRERQSVTDLWLTSQQSYAGGLAAEQSHMKFCGVIEGEPDSAARNRIRVDVTIEELKRWLDEQISILEEEEVRGRAALEYQALAVRIDNASPRLPVAFAHDGLVNRDEFIARVATLDEFFVIEGFTTDIVLPDVSYQVITTDDGFALPGPSQFVVPDESGSWFLNSPTRTDRLEDESIRGHQYWNLIFEFLPGELVRLAAEAWSLPLEEVIPEITSHHFSPDGSDTRISLDNLDGTQSLVDAVRVSRPGRGRGPQ